MRSVSVSRKVSSTKNLVKFCHFLQAGKTLFSVVSHYLKVVESAVRTYTTRGGNSPTQKSQNISNTFILFLSNPPKST